MPSYKILQGFIYAGTSQHPLKRMTLIYIHLNKLMCPSQLFLLAIWTNSHSKACDPKTEKKKPKKQQTQLCFRLYADTFVVSIR